MTNIFNAQPNVTDFSNARPVPHQKLELTPEIRARIEEGLARSRAAWAALAEMERKSQELAKGYESNHYNPRNASSMSREEALHQIEYVSELIQTGQSEKYSLSTSHNGRITSDFRQYLYWIQQHVKALDAAGSSTLAEV
jgi:hypothetical protein